MHAKDVLGMATEFSHMLVGTYVADLKDADLMVRSVPGTNHIAWQLGHMIAGTHEMLASLGHRPLALPDGFAASYNQETASSDDPSRFATKAECLALIEKMKTATLAAIAATPDADLDKPGPESMREYAPTIGAALMITGTHWLMHAGQFVPIRRKLGKPAMF